MLLALLLPSADDVAGAADVASAAGSLALLLPGAGDVAGAAGVASATGSTGAPSAVDAVAAVGAAGARAAALVAGANVVGALGAARAAGDKDGLVCCSLTMGCATHIIACASYAWTLSTFDDVLLRTLVYVKPYCHLELFASEQDHS